MAICLSLKSIKKRRTNSSTKLDLPAPPASGMKEMQIQEIKTIHVVSMYRTRS